MSATLINPAAHWVDDGSDSAPLTQMVLAATGPNSYTFATRARAVAGSLVPRVGGGYVVTLGVMNGSGIVAKNDTTIIIF